MKVTRRLKITVTQRRVLRSAIFPIRAFCSVCACEVTTLTLAQTAAVLEISSQRLEDLITAGRVHTIPMVSGGLRCCQDSLWIGK